MPKDLQLRDVALGPGSTKIRRDLEELDNHRVRPVWQDVVEDAGCQLALVSGGIRTGALGNLCVILELLGDAVCVNGNVIPAGSPQDGANVLIAIAAGQDLHLQERLRGREPPVLPSGEAKQRKANQSQLAAALDLQFGVEESNDLISWTDATVEVIGSVSDGEITTATVRVPLPGDQEQTRGFVRVAAMPKSL